MLDGNRITPNDVSQQPDRRCGDDGVCLIGDVLAELLDQYRIRFSEINVMVVEKPSTAS